MNIAERIEQLMQTKGINRHQLSLSADIPYTTLDGIHKKGGENIKLTTLIKLTDYFNVSTDYLIGRGSDVNLEVSELNELDSFRKYLEWRKENGQT